jgi:hypothetical protein
MLGLEDQRWNTFLGARQARCDPRPARAKLQSPTTDAIGWRELWEAPHHQGDVGEASVAFVPHLLDVYRERPSRDWNAIIATVELARKCGHNPDVPTWLDSGYFDAIQQLRNLG